MTNDTEVWMRDANAGDAPTVASIWASGWKDGHLGHVPDELVRARTPESFDERAAARVADTRVATVDDEVVGFTMIHGDELEQVYVAAAARGHGVANILIADAEARIRAAGHSSAWLAVVTGNARARRFYERSGWVDEGAFDYEAKSGGGVILVPSQRYTKQLRD